MYQQKCIASDRKFLPYGILHSFNLGLTYEETLANLVTSQEKNPVFYPRVHAQDVEFWYNSFKNGNFNLNQTPTQNPGSNLLNLPVIDQVIHNVNAADQQGLRKTCKSLKNFIEEENRLYEKIEFRLTKDSVMLEVECGIRKTKSRTVFNKTDDGCDIVKDRNKRSKSEGDFMELAQTEFRKTVAMLHTKIKALIVNYNVYKTEEEDRKRFLKGVTDVLSTLKEPIHVENLNLNIREEAELEMFLKALKSGVLTDLHVNVEDKNDARIEAEELPKREFFRTQKIPSLANHWDHLRSVHVDSDPVTRKLQDFAHIPHVFITLAEITPKHIKEYKKKVVHQSNFQTHTFYKSTLFGNAPLPVLVWKEAMQPFEPVVKDFDGDEEEVIGFVPFLDGSTDVLRFKIQNGFAFSRRNKKSNLSDW